MRTTEMVLFAPFLKTSKFIPACISIYILSLDLMFRNRTIVTDGSKLLDIRVDEDEDISSNDDESCCVK